MTKDIVPAGALICGLVACLNAASWALITPPFQVTDEPAHFAYVKQIAETGTLPTPQGSFSAEEEFALEAVRLEQIRQNPETPAIFSQAQQRALTEFLLAAARTPGRGSPGAAVATSEPPLYYAIEAIPYDLASGGTLLDRLQLMRLLSACFAGLTALFTFLFLREALPHVRWGWTVGALGVALSPLLGFTSGAVTPDAMLFAVSAALFYCLARAFRRGLTAKSGAALGILITVGFLTKLNFAGLAPGAFLALGILAVRDARRSGRRALRAPAIAALLGSLPVAAFALSRHATSGLVASAADSTRGSVLATANYIWQLYLPRLPGTPNDFPGLLTTIQIWFDGYIGRFGWLDTFFPAWVYTAALIIAVALAGLCIRTLLAHRDSVRDRLPELTVYAVMTLGLLGLVGFASDSVFPGQLADFGQARYLLPLLPLLGAAIALAARGAGRRWGPATGALIVMLCLAHDLFSQLQVVARYYG